MQTSPFAFLDPGLLADNDGLSLTLAGTEMRGGGLVPQYNFHMVWNTDVEPVGGITLRVSETPDTLLYYGHVGYTVRPERRGQHFALRALRLLLPFARRHGLSSLWITCSPDNGASRRTAEHAGAVYVETVDVPNGLDLYRRGERQKCRYRIDLDAARPS